MTQIKVPISYDVSRWQGSIDWARVSPRPILVVCKATEGIFFSDPTYRPNMTGLLANGIRRGVYHFHRKAYPPTQQATYFLNAVRGTLTPNDLIALDIEEGGETAAQLISWLDLVGKEYSDNLIMLYSRKTILDLIVTSATQAARLKTYPTWIAGYPSNPDFFTDIPVSYVPDKTKWGMVWLWQYNDKGLVAGIQGSAVDLNKIMPVYAEILAITLPPVPETVTHPYFGVIHYEGTAHGWKYFIQVIDPAQVRYEIYESATRETVSSVAQRKGAAIATNGGEWDRVTGEPKNISGAPYITFNPLEINHQATSRPRLTGLRYLVQSGGVAAYLNGIEPQYTEGHSRTIEGVTANGFHIKMVSEGVYPNQGLTLKQAAEIVKAHGAVTAFDSGGGGDSTLYINGRVYNVPEDVDNGVRVERRIPEVLLIYPNITGGTNSMNGTAQESLGNIVTKRDKPSRYGGNVGSVNRGATIDFVKQVDVVVSGPADGSADKWLLLPDNSYVNLILNGLMCFKILTQPTTTNPPPATTLPELPVHIVIGDDLTYKSQTIDIILKSK